MATRTWSSVGSNDMNDSANYSGAGALLATDDLVFDNTSVVNATATADLDVRSITVAANYTGAWSIAGHTAIAEVGDMSFDGSGTLNLGNGITMNGASATFHIGAGVGAVTAGSCILTMNGTTGMVIDNDVNITLAKIVLGNSAVVTVSGAGVVTCSNTVTPLALGDSSSFVINKIIFFKLYASTAFATIGTGAMISGSAGIYFQIAANSITATLPAITTTTPSVWLIPSGLITGWTIQLTGAFNTSGDLNAICNQGNNTGTFDFNGMDVTVGGTLFVGTNQASSSITYNYGAGNFSVAKYDGATYNAGTNNNNLQGSVWDCSGNWTFGSNHTIVPGTSQITFTNTATVTSNGKIFYDFVINAAGKTITLADALSCHDFTNIAGTLAGVFSVTSSGDVYLYADTTFNRLIMTKATTRTITVAATRTMTLTNLTNTNLNGGAGALNRWRSFTPGSMFNLVVPAPITLAYQNPRDSSASQLIDVTDGTSVDGGNNINWVFPPAGSMTNKYQPQLSAVLSCSL